MTATPYLTDMTPEEFGAFCAPLGILAHEARRIYAHQVNSGHRDWNVRDVAKKKLAALAERVQLPRLDVVARHRSPTDGFTKYVFALADGQRVEAVRIPIFEDKYTLCISSQAGCALGCVFCATGKMGFIRNLASWEIVEQVRVVREEADRPIRGIVFMGMGEPFLNYDNVIRAAKILSAPAGGAISGKAITISTAGVVPQIHRYTAERHSFRLAISFTGATPQKRKSLMPVENTWSTAQLMEAIAEHARVTRDRVTIEYVLISGVNCGADDARALVELFSNIPIRFNVIDVNDASGVYLPPSDAERNAFLDALRPMKQPIVRRYSGGKDVNGACGMLANVSPTLGASITSRS